MKPINFSSFRKKHNGLTMVELMIVMAVGAVLLYLAFSFYLYMNNQTKTDALKNTTTHMITAVGNQWRMLGSFRGLNNDNVIKGEIVPKALAIEGSKIIHPFGGEITFTTDANGSYIQMTATDIPASACKELVGMMNATAHYISIGNVVVRDGAAKIDMDKTVTACNSDLSTIVVRVR